MNIETQVETQIAQLSDEELRQVKECLADTYAVQPDRRYSIVGVFWQIYIGSMIFGVAIGVGLHAWLGGA